MGADTSDDLGLLSACYIHKAAHFFRRLTLHFVSDVGIGVQSKSGGVVAQHPGKGFDVHTVLQR